MLGFVLVIWSITPIYNMFMIALDSHADVFSGQVWPEHPSLENFRVVVTEDFWVPVALLASVRQQLLRRPDDDIPDLAHRVAGQLHGWADASAPRLDAEQCGVDDLRDPRGVPGDPAVSDQAGIYGLMNSLWAVIFSMVTFATPYAIFIFSQYGGKVDPDGASDKVRSDFVDGANPLQIYLLLYLLSLMAPALVAVGTYALLLAWNEYLYNFLMLSTPQSMTVAVALAQFLNSDESPWNFMMATAIIYAVPPVALYFYCFRRYMAAGLTMGGVKG